MFSDSLVAFSLKMEWNTAGTKRKHLNIANKGNVYGEKKLKENDDYGINVWGMSPTD